MGRSLRMGVVALLSLVVLTWIGTKADDQCLENHACTFFHAMDYNRDNVCTYLDFILEWLRVPLIKGTNGQITKDVQRQLTIAQLFPLADTNLDKCLMQGGVKMPDFLQTIRAKRNTPEFKKQIADLVTLDMKVFNYDGDESTFTPNEWGMFVNIFRIGAEDAKTAFNKMDTNEDNLLSFDEYYTAGCDYFITCLDERNAWFLGRPTTCEEIIKNVAACDDPIAIGSLKIPVIASIGSMDVLNLLFTLVPRFPILNTLLGAIGIVPAVVGSVLGAVGGLLSK